MRDSRLDKLAGLILSHSIHISRGEAFHVTADDHSRPLVKALLREAKKIGAMVQVELTSQEISRLQLELYDPDDGGVSAAFLADKAEIGIRMFQNLAGEVSIRSYQNDQELSGIPPAVLQLAGRQGKTLEDLVVNHRRWVLFEYPTPGQAQRAGMSFDDYFDFVLSVSCVDYAAMQQSVKPLKQLMERTDRVHITGPGTDLSFSINGLPAIPCCGEFNIPDGECFTAPVKDSVQGVITYNTPSIYWGHTFSGIRLEFAEGRIVKASAGQSGDFIDKIFDTDEGARYIGEFAIGFNPLILEPFCNTLFDEKICGSFHFTPGDSYDEVPNGNKSSIHWDLVLIQRLEYGGGEIWFDDTLVRKDGLFTLPELSGLNPA
jgi:aminopeptidase